MQLDNEYLMLIGEMIHNIRMNRPMSLEGLQADVVLEAAILRWLEVIGAAAANVSTDFTDLHPEIHLDRFVDLYQRLIKVDFKLDQPWLWDLIGQDLPILGKQVARVLQDHS